jgi:hypothetical protein
MTRLLSVLFLAGAVCVGLSSTGCGKKNNSGKSGSTGVTTEKETSPKETTEEKETKEEKETTEEKETKPAKKKGVTKGETKEEGPEVPPKKGTTKGVTKTEKKGGDESSAVMPNRPRPLARLEVPAATYGPGRLTAREAILRQQYCG